MKLRILFVIGQAALGGIETYCLRMCRELDRKGHTLDVWFVKPGGDKALLQEFRKVANVRFLSRIAPVPILPITPKAPSDCDLIFSTGRLSLIFGALALRGAPLAPLIAGVFSQWEYSGVVDDYKSRISHEILEQIGWKNLVFCTEGCRTFHLEMLGEQVNKSLVSPLLVELPLATPSSHNNRPEGAPLRIISVGSFTPFKTYHFTLPAVLSELRKKGRLVEWTIFGDGIERTKIEQCIAEAGVGDIVRLAGRLDYARFPEVVGTADLYIGAGTTLIEASALGIPSLVALDDNLDPTTPGFFADRKGNYTSDYAEGEQLIPFQEAITEFLTMSTDRLEILRKASIARARTYSIESAEQEIINIIAQAKPSRLHLGLTQRLRYTFGVIREVTRVLLGRGAYRVR